MFLSDQWACIEAEFAAELLCEQPTELSPLNCDRWVARSLLQKAIRRSESKAALQALARLFIDAPSGVWRALTIIALEDVGAPGFDVVARIVMVARDRPLRMRLGGDWRVASALVHQMAESRHCQAACDLLMRATNDPSLSSLRLEVLDGDHSQLTRQFETDDFPPEKLAIVSLALGGGLSEGQPIRDPGAVFHIMSEGSYSPEVVEVCHAAWRICRNPMALLLPIIWKHWADADTSQTLDDPIPSTSMIGDVPAYGLDQFTRSGLSAIRAYLGATPDLRNLIADIGVPPAQRMRVTADLVFLAEGSALRRRAIWSTGEDLRSPFRPLPGPFLLHDEWETALGIVRRQAPLIDVIRWQLFQPSIASILP